jgi:hypothetical protein
MCEFFAGHGKGFVGDTHVTEEFLRIQVVSDKFFPWWQSELGAKLSELSAQAGLAAAGVIIGE